MKKKQILKPFQNALVVSNYHQMFDDLKKNKIRFKSEPSESAISDSIRDDSNAKVTFLEEDMKYMLDIHAGEEFIKSNYSSISAYDESIMKIPSLKGIAYFTCHCIIRMTEKDFDPICSLNANYFTRAKDVAKNSEVFHYLGYDQDGNPENMESIYKLYYHEDRSDLILKNIPDHSILLIDGPLVGQQLTSRTRSMAKSLLERDIITIFIVKNSDSLMLVQELNDSGKYNSDLDWADENLSPGSRSSYIKYKDQKGGNSEIFCYLKSFDNVSPLRISFMEEIYKGKDLVNSIMNLIYYLVIDQGTPKDPQLRLVSVAEMYAKEIIKYANPYGKMQSIGLVPTVNQSRWGRG